MEPEIILGIISKDHEVLRWVLVIIGGIFLFFGASMYYSAIRLFGTVIGTVAGIIVCQSVTMDGSITGLSLTLLFILCGIIGALIGSTLAMIFHHVIFFIAGAIIGIILFKMFAQGLITPEVFHNIDDFSEFYDLVKPTCQLDAFIMIIGGIMYMLSSHLLIVMTMSLVGSFIIAYAFHLYVLFPVLAVFGGLIQYTTTRKQKLQLVKKSKKSGKPSGKKQ